MEKTNMSNRTKSDSLRPKNEIDAQYYLALAVSAPAYSTYELARDTIFSKRFATASRARAVVAFDRVLNKEIMNYMLEKIHAEHN